MSQINLFVVHTEGERGKGPPLPAPGPLMNNPPVLLCVNHNGQQLAYIYVEDKPSRRSAAKLLTKDEARRIAANICRS